MTASTRFSSSRTLVLLRHGSSEWNRSERFTGWSDPALSQMGARQAYVAARWLARAGLAPDAVFTSQLRRATRTAAIVAIASRRPRVELRRSWRLNERQYGALEGRPKAAVIAEFGEPQVRAWRRSLDEPLPSAPTASSPRGERFSEVFDRVHVYWTKAIRRRTLRGGVVLVVAHSNSLRALVQCIAPLAPADLEDLYLPLAVPLVFHLDGRARVIAPGGRYVDVRAARAGILASRDEGSRPMQGAR